MVLKGKLVMLLAHFGFHGHGLGMGFLPLVIALACVVIVATWPGKTEPK
jgi:hypothetical protein